MISFSRWFIGLTAGELSFWAFVNLNCHCLPFYQHFHHLYGARVVGSTYHRQCALGEGMYRVYRICLELLGRNWP